MSISERYAEFITELNFEDLPVEVVENIKMRLLDSLGIMVPANSLETTKIVAKFVESMSGKPESTVIGTDLKVPLANALLVNGMMGHSFDFDDTHSGTLIHASSCVMPAALSVAEANNLSGKDLILLATIGFEIMIRIGLVAPGRFHARGFHTTSIAGTFAASAISSKGMALTKEQTVNALGIAGSLPSGLLQCLKDGSWTKLIHSGWADHAGVLSASIAKDGFTGPRDIFEGDLGFMDAYLHGEPFNKDAFLDGLNETWETTNISFKLYPTCHFTHALLDCIGILKQSHKIDPATIVEIECIVPKGMVPIICEPKQAKQAPETEYGERFSLYFCMAAGILEDRITINTFTTDKLSDKRYLDLAQKVNYTVHEFDDFPTYLPGWIKIKLSNGEVLEHRVKSCRGPFGEPVTFADIEGKFRDNTQGVLSTQQQDEIVASVCNLDKLSDVKSLIALTAIDSKK